MKKVTHAEVIESLRRFAAILEAQERGNRIEEYGIGGSCSQVMLDGRLLIRVEVVSGFVDGVPQTGKSDSH